MGSVVAGPVLRERALSRPRSTASTPTPWPGTTTATWSACSPTPASCATAPRYARPWPTPAQSSPCATRAGSSSSCRRRAAARARSRPSRPRRRARHQPASVALARSLKAAGLRFVGPTTAYAALQASASSTTASRAATCRARRAPDPLAGRLNPVGPGLPSMTRWPGPLSGPRGPTSPWPGTSRARRPRLVLRRPGRGHRVRLVGQRAGQVVRGRDATTPGGQAHVRERRPGRQRGRDLSRHGSRASRRGQPRWPGRWPAPPRRARCAVAAAGPWPGRSRPGAAGTRWSRSPPTARSR